MGKELKRSTARANNYYMYTANAVAPDYRWEEEWEEERPVQQASKVRKKPQKHFMQLLGPNLLTLSLIFMMALASVGQHVYIQNISHNINQSREELKAVSSENEKLKKQVAALGELQTIEAYAINNMGMIKPEEDSVLYLPQSETAAEQDAGNGEERQQEQGSIGSALRSFLGVITNS